MGKFRESATAHRYLDGLKGLEVGGGAHNSFGLNTINVDSEFDPKSKYKQMEIEMCGECMEVDICASGDNIPVADKSFDFVISSHVIEHFYDPIKALLEWKRIACKYIYIICPHKDRTFDKDRPLTTLVELIERHKYHTIEVDHPNDHYSVWNTHAFLELLEFMKFNVVEAQDFDDKVGNGFAVVIKLF